MPRPEAPATPEGQVDTPERQAAAPEDGVEVPDDEVNTPEHRVAATEHRVERPEVQVCTADPNMETNWSHKVTLPAASGTISGFTPGGVVWVRVRSGAVAAATRHHPRSQSWPKPVSFDRTGGTIRHFCIK